MNNPNANKSISQKTLLIENLPFDTEKMIGIRARIGVIVLSTDYTIEHEFRKIIVSPGVDFYHARIANSVTITTKTLSDMKPLITQTADLILPGDDLDVIAYGCTSASVVLGDHVIANLLNAAKPTAKTTNPAYAATAAFNALGAKRIAILTPYEREVNELLQRSMEKKGFDVPIFGSFNENHDPTVAAINETSLLNAVTKLTSLSQVDAVFISCTSVKIVDSIKNLEKKIKIPITSSNHALAWHCLRLVGIDETFPHLGKLYEYGLHKE
jgi:maleate isomerase